jgi:hypothetical protein
MIGTTFPTKTLAAFVLHNIVLHQPIANAPSMTISTEVASLAITQFIFPLSHPIGLVSYTVPVTRDCIRHQRKCKMDLKVMTAIVFA